MGVDGVQGKGADFFKQMDAMANGTKAQQKQYKQFMQKAIRHFTESAMKRRGTLIPQAPKQSSQA